MRCAVLPLPASRRPQPPPGVDPSAYAWALAEDVAELLHGLAGIDTLVLSTPDDLDRVRSLVWPEVQVLARPHGDLPTAVAVAAELGYAEMALVAADAPDLPPLVLAKVFQALARTPVAVAAAEGGGAVVIGLRLPVPAWLPDVDLDTPDIGPELLRAAPGRQHVAMTPGWHRLRLPADVHRLDPGLEGWEATRALLGAFTPRGA